MMLMMLGPLLASTLLTAEPPQGFRHWSGAELKTKTAGEPLGNFGNHSFMLAYRETNGEAELHEKQNDIFVAEAGAATLVVGGTIVDRKTTAPGEVRGKSITGGATVQLSPGDIVHIPAGTPHQLLIQPGAKLTYFVIKVAAQ